MVSTNKRAELAKSLFDVGAIKFASQPGEFKLKLHERNPDAPLSPIYLNLRTADHPKNPGPLTANQMKLIAELFEEVIRDTEIQAFKCIADIPDAGEPFGNAAQEAASKNGFIYAERIVLQKEVLPDGTRRITDEVVGEFGVGDICLLVDDLITGADTKLEAIKALEGAGLTVHDVLVVVDRLQGGSEQLEAEGYKVWPIFTLDYLLAFYVNEGLIEPAKRDEVVSYIMANSV